MSSRKFYAIIGAIIGGGSDVIANLLAAAIQQRAFLNQFSDQALWVLAGLAILGLLVGLWSGGPVHLPSPSAPPLQLQEDQTLILLTLLVSWPFSLIANCGERAFISAISFSSGPVLISKRRREHFYDQ